MTTDREERLGAARAALRRGDVGGAERLCKAVVGESPEATGAWSLLAETALLRGRGAAARACAERAVALDPSDPLAQVMRAKAALQDGDLQEALAAVRAARPHVWSDASAADATGALCALLGRYDESLALARRAVELAPEEPQYLFNLAATERALGLLAEAVTHSERAIGLRPDHAHAHYLRSDLPDDGKLRERLATHERLLSVRGTDWRSATLLHFSLVREYEEVNEPSRAFEHAELGARLWRSHFDYDVRREIDALDRVRELQTREWVGQLPRGEEASDPIFICGLPRTGTTLLERLVCGGASLRPVGESGLFALELDRERRRGIAEGPSPANIGRAYVELTRRLHEPGAARIVDKTLQNYLYCGWIHAALPRARILVLERDPLDAAWAMYKAHFASGFLFTYDLAELAGYVRAWHGLIEHWSSVLPPEAFMTVRYENLVRRTSEEARRIFAFLGLAWDEKVLGLHAHGAPSASASAVQVRRPVYGSSIGRWRSLSRQLEPFRVRFEGLRKTGE
jgi:tetratricopeptide (TPR) repeat protein